MFSFVKQGSPAELQICENQQVMDGKVSTLKFFMTLQKSEVLLMNGKNTYLYYLQCDLEKII